MGQGFRLPESDIAVLTSFPEPYAGAEVKVRLDVPIGIYIAIEDLRDQQKFWDVVELFTKEVLSEWNLETAKGEPLPTTWAGVKTVPQRFVMMVINNWVEAASSVPDPLEGPSSNGAGSVEESTLAQISQLASPGDSSEPDSSTA